MTSKIIITGCTGTAGSEALRQALLHPSISQVTVLTRRPLPAHVAPEPPNPKLNVIIHKDFLSYPPTLLEQLKGHDGVVWDLGITSVGMKEPDYQVITVDYAMAAAKAFSGLAPDGKKFVFAYLSGRGTSQDESKARQMFGRVKGRAEKQLAELNATDPLIATYSFRPGGIFPVEKIPEAPFVMRAAVSIFGALKPIANTLGIFTDTLAQGMIESVLVGGKGSIDIEGLREKGKVGDKGTFDDGEIKKLARESLLAAK